MRDGNKLVADGPSEALRDNLASVRAMLAILGLDPLAEVWQTSWYGSSKTIDVHVAALRRKLGDPSWIETVRGVGFRLHVP